MSISMQTNVASIRSQRNLAKATNSFTGSIEKLSSGLRINRAGDDAARSAISSQMTAQERGLKQATRNANDAISVVQTAEGGVNEIANSLTRMRELAVQSSTDGTMQRSDRRKLDTEFRVLLKRVAQISRKHEFNGQKLFDGSISGSANALNFQIGMNNNANDRISLSIAGLGRTELGLSNAQNGGGGGLYVEYATHAQIMIDKLDIALESINTVRSSLGATQNRLEATISNLGTMYENMATSNSRLKDVDVADETAKFTRNQILSQAATSMLAQSNSLPQSALSLIG